MFDGAGQGMCDLLNFKTGHQERWYQLCSFDLANHSGLLILNSVIDFRCYTTLVNSEAAKMVETSGAADFVSR